MPANPPAAPARGAFVLLVFAFAGAVAVLVSRSWIIDDAYITLRMIDNWVNGYGLRWNVAERVQAFTHPLWMLVLAVPYSVTREAYFTSLLTSLVCSSVALWLVAFRLSADRVAAALVLVVLAASRAFTHFSASNLESPLAHLLLAWLAVESFRQPSTDPARVVRVALAGGLLVLVRMDFALLVGPIVASRIWRARMRALPAAIAGAGPLAAWTIVAIVYYGFPFPNTAYAKLAHGVPLADLTVQGLCYLLESLVQDPVTLLTVGAAVLAAMAAPGRGGWPVAAGLLLYLGYVVRIGGDYMSGRFFAAPCLLAIAWLAARPAGDRSRRRWLAVLAFAGLAAFASRSIVTPAERVAFLKRHFADDDPKWSRARARNTFRYIIDQRGDRNGTSLFAVLTSGERELRHPWIDLGRRLANGPPRVFVYGAVGLLGYYGGPGLHLVDAAGLGDPLLARLPATYPWFVGHYDRRVPDGYVETLQTGQNTIAHPDVRAYYNDLRLVTEGPIWSVARLRAIRRLNLGGLDRLADYGSVAATADEPAAECAFRREAGVELWERGLRLYLPASCAATRVRIAASGPARYVLTYYSSGRALAAQQVKVPDDRGDPIVDEVALRPDATFDRVDVRLANDAHPATLWRLRFSR